MSMESKGRKKSNIEKELERRQFNLQSVLNILKYSINGIVSYAKDGKSIILYVLGLIAEIILGFAFKVNGLEWILIICMFGIVLAVELLNTAIESVCDAVTKEYNPLIKIAKDCGSAATFVIFIVILILNIIIFYPKIFMMHLM